MIATATAERLPALRAGLLLAGLAAATGLRQALPQDGEAGLLGAAAVFAGLLLGLALCAGWRTHGAATAAMALAPTPTRRSELATALLWGAAGAALLCAPPLLHHLGSPHPATAPLGAYLPWAAGTALVAAAEEALLRGALFDAVAQIGGEGVAVAVAAVAFALLHVPHYGWAALPLDLGVGVWLGCLRLLSGRLAAPVLAHVGADLAGWWL